MILVFSLLPVEEIMMTDLCIRYRYLKLEQVIKYFVPGLLRCWRDV